MVTSSSKLFGARSYTSHHWMCADLPREDLSHGTSLVRMIVWRISARKTHSDHQAIFLDLENDGNEIRKHIGGGKIRIVGRPIGTFNKKISLTALKGGHGLWRERAMEIVGKLCHRITGGCDTTMHRRYIHHNIKPNYWRNHEK